MGNSDIRSDIALLHRRAGFGVGPAELDRLAPAGYEAAVEELLASLAGAPPAGDLAPPSFGPSADEKTPEGRAQLRTETTALMTWWLERMVTTTAPLREKLTLFWHGHFATSIEKVRLPALMLAQNDLLRRLGGGDFETLAQAVAKDPAMLVWLDAGSNNKTHPNENFARELMELFTLGIGNYSEADVKEAARAFTGWRVDRVTGTFAIAARQHDDGTKTVLGQSGPSSCTPSSALLPRGPGW